MVLELYWALLQRNLPLQMLKRQAAAPASPQGNGTTG
jgi:hypothetical protein